MQDRTTNTHTKCEIRSPVATISLDFGDSDMPLALDSICTDKHPEMGPEGRDRSAKGEAEYLVEL